MKLIGSCLLALAILGCLAEGQFMKPQQPQKPQPPPQPQQPQRPNNPPQKLTPPKPQQPQQPQLPQPQKPHQPQKPQQPQQPQTPHQPKQPQQPTEVFHSCEVEDSKKIQCGGPSISADECSAINCCFDGRMCYYGKAVTLQCTKDGQMIVVVARDATLPNLDLESITFLGTGQQCSPVGTTSAFAIYQFPVTGCGTTMTDESGVVVYENRMSSFYEVAIGELGAITRDSHYDLLVQCRYIGVSVEALVIEVGNVPPPPPVAAPGPFFVELRLGNGECTAKGCVEEQVAYTSFYGNSDYPVTKVLRDPVYVEVRMLERTDPNIVLTLGRCWATADAFPHSLPQWDLLIDGCPYTDDRYMTALIPVGPSSGLMYPTHHSRFVFKMFTFVSTGPSNPSKKVSDDPQVMTPLKEKVYIHCDAAVCQPTPGNNCEPRCFRRRRSVAAARQKTLREESKVVSSQQVIFLNSSA
ncbi:zona pellucida sperm-binding protein 4-like [Synchiropus picturatus]